MNKAEDAEDPFEKQVPSGNVYKSIHISGDARVHLGDSHTHSKNGYREQLLRSLHSPLLEQRRNAIKDAAQNTFDWIFEDVDIGTAQDSISGTSKVRPRCDRAKSGFIQWLRHGSGTYWISGKPGSGKSTLMSFIVEDDRTRSALDTWSGSREIEILSYYFWRPGADIQKSTAGLLRGLLYQLCEPLSEKDAEKLVDRLRFGFRRPQKWTEKTLRRGIVEAIKLSTNKSFCIFVDGLDEYLGDYHELIDLIEMLAGVDNVRCCVSSRPDVQLRQRLQSCESLRLQDYNTADIHEYVRGKLYAARMKSSSNRRLLSAIVRRAEGVFLWAVLVTQTLVRGAACGDSDDSLMERLDNTPGEISDLFAEMFSAIDEHHKQSLIFFFQALLSQNGASNSFGSICDIAACTLSQPGSYQEFEAECSRVEQQILGQSAGLLEIADLSEIDEFGARVWNDDTSWTLGYCKFDVPNLRHVQRATRERKSEAELHKRQRMDDSSPFPKMLKYESRIPQWIHRCAHDFLFESDVTQDIAAAVRAGLSDALQRLCTGRMDYIAIAPSFALSNDNRTSTEWRLSHLLRSLGQVKEERPRAEVVLLDHLRLVLSCIDIDEVCDRPWAELRDSRFDWAGHKILFWEICATSGFWEYVLQRVELLALDPAGTTLHICMMEQASRHAWNLGRYEDNLSPEEDQQLRQLSGIIEMLSQWIARSLFKACMLAKRSPASTKVFHARMNRNEDFGPIRYFRSVSCHTSLHHLPKPGMQHMEGLMLASLVRAYFLLERLTERKTSLPGKSKVQRAQCSLETIFQLLRIQSEVRLESIRTTGRRGRVVLHATPGFVKSEEDPRPTEGTSISKCKRQNPRSMRIIKFQYPHEQPSRGAFDCLAEDANVIETNHALTKILELQIKREGLSWACENWSHRQWRRNAQIAMILRQEISQSPMIEMLSETRQQTLADALSGLSLKDETTTSIALTPNQNDSEEGVYHDSNGEQLRLKDFERNASHCRPWPRDPPS